MTLFELPLRAKFGIALATMGGILALVSLALFASQMSISQQPAASAWTFYFASLAAWGVGGALWTGQRDEKVGKRTKGFSPLLIPILLLAALLRLSELDTLPYGMWYDEALNAVDTREIIQEPANRPLIEHNTTFLHYVLFAASMSATGLESIVGVRLVQALFGVASVVMAYLVGQRLRGETFGLLFAFTLAVMRWSINFSRIGMTGVEVTFFVLLAFYTLHRLVQDGKLRDALLAGAALGFGLWFYRAFQLLLIPLFIYVLLAWRWRAYGWRRTFGVAAVAGATLLIVAQPLGLAAILQPELLFGRIDQTSIFAQDLGGRPVLDVIGESTLRHLRMFHFGGDYNGRHNLPHVPMLDVVTGVLVVGGLALALIRIVMRKGWREHVFFLLLAVFSLASGVLSIPSEAPQGLRVIGVLPAVAYFAALAAEALVLLVQRIVAARGSMRLVWGAAGIVALALALPMAALNYDVYFRQQRASYASFISFSTPETLAARALRDLPPDSDIWISPSTGLGVQATLLAADRRAHSRSVDLYAALPIAEAPTTDISILVGGEEAVTIGEISRLYPAARIQPINASDFGVIVPSDQRDTLLYVVTLTPANVAAADAGSSAGLLARYYENTTWTGNPALERRELFVYRYIVNVPVRRPYSAEWTGSVYAPTRGNYTFGLRAISAAWLSIDGVDLLQTIEPNQPTTVVMMLEAGWHEIVLRQLDSDNYSRIYLEWLPPGEREMMPITSEFLRLP